MTLARLIFNNADAKPRSIVIECTAASVAHIMAWYGAYFAGDRYTVTLDGRNVPIDHNGEPTDAAILRALEQEWR